MPMATERLHQVEHTEVNPATNALNGALVHQTHASERRRRSIGDILRNIGWGFGLSAGAVVVGDTIKSTQSQSTTDTLISGIGNSSITTSGGGWLNGLGTALVDVGFIGLALTTATAAVVAYELFRNHRQEKRNHH